MFRVVLILSALATSALSQTIYPTDIYQTTWDKTKLFTQGSSSGSAINFGTKGAIGQADIVVDDGTVYQQMDGFGASFTDSAAKVLSQLKSTNSNNYWSVLNSLFNPSDNATGAGISYIRIPLGASDLSDTSYTYDDTKADTSLSKFSIEVTPSYVFSVLKDIQSVNGILKLHFVPWSPPAWMKASTSVTSIKGGAFSSSYVDTYAKYLLKAVQAWKAKGFPAYAVGIQNEPKNSNPTYPSATFTAAVEAQIALALRTLLDSNGLSSVKIIGYEHNWSDVVYPKTIMSQASSAVSGASFHCYGGGVKNQTAFHSAYPSKEVYMTECVGTIGSDWWSDVKWHTDNIWIGAPENWARTGAVWSLAADGNGLPVLPGTNSCNSGCRGVVQVNSDGTYSFNQEFYGMAQANKAIVPKDAGGAWGQRISTTVGGSTGWGLRVAGYKTTRVNSADWNRYSLVILNWDDSSSTSWNPQSITTTIEFRGKQATYTFPVGVTTLWWYAVN